MTENFLFNLLINYKLRRVGGYFCLAKGTFWAEASILFAVTTDCSFFF